MLEHDDESTTFEPNPLGNRQRLKPRDSFLARQAKPVEEGTAAVRLSMIVAEQPCDDTHDEALVAGDHTISDVVLPASSAVMLPAMAIATPVPSISYAAPPMPQAAALMLLPREIHYPPIATPYYPPTDTHTALPIASRRVRYIAVPLIAMLALVVLGGAMIPPKVESMSGPAANVAATTESTSDVRTHETACDPPAPAEEIEAKPIARATSKRVGAKPRKITVNTSSALGNLRPRKAW